MQAGLLLLLTPVGAPVTLWSSVICRYTLTEKKIQKSVTDLV